MSAGAFFVWIAEDDSAILGLGVGVEAAYEDARKRHGEARGYPVRVILDGYEAPSQPQVPIAHALWSAAGRKE